MGFADLGINLLARSGIFYQSTEIYKKLYYNMALNLAAGIVNLT
jgi:hypothetical protein